MIVDDYLSSAGLCSVCANVQIVKSHRGPLYFLCGMSKINSAFAKYPVLPVLRCPGFRPKDSAENTDPLSGGDSSRLID